MENNFQNSKQGGWEHKVFCAEFTVLCSTCLLYLNLHCTYLLCATNFPCPSPEQNCLWQSLWTLGIYTIYRVVIHDMCIRAPCPSREASNLEWPSACNRCHILTVKNCSWQKLNTSLLTSMKQLFTTCFSGISNPSCTEMSICLGEKNLLLEA